MNDPLIVVLLSRGLERMASILVGGLSIYFGWKLFLVRSLHERGELSAEFQQFKLILRQVGPGIFFSLFGACIVSISLVRGIAFDAEAALSVRNSQNVGDRSRLSDEEHTTKVHFQGMGDTADRTESLRQVIALNNVLRVLDINSNQPDQLTARILDLQGQKSLLTGMRDKLVFENEGKDLMDKWKKVGDKFRQNPMAFTTDERAQLQEVQKWYSTIPLEDQ